MTVRLEKVSSEWEIDPLVKGLTPGQLDNDVNEYRALLDSNASEERIHEFLASHSYFFNTILRLYGVSPLYSKIRLGADYETDFVWFDTSSFGPDWRLAEIEAPSRKLFTKSGNPSHSLTHAIQQVRDWHTWIDEHKQYSRELMPRIEYPLGYVFIGRRKDLTPTIKKKLRRLRYEQRMFLEIHTLDFFIACANSVRNLLERNGRGDWIFPMRALTYSDLKQGLPPLAQKFIDSSIYDELVQLRLKDREWKILRDEESGYID